MNANKTPSLRELIEEYKTLPQHCDGVNYVDPDSIKRNNKAVKRMSKIVSIINNKFGQSGVSQLKPLLEIEESKTNLWIATHLLEQADVDDQTEKKALEIIRRVSATDPILKVGYDHWLKMYSGETKND